MVLSRNVHAGSIAHRDDIVDTSLEVYASCHCVLSSTALALTTTRFLLPYCFGVPYCTIAVNESEASTGPF